MAVLEMAKKRTDGRSSRYVPIMLEELESARDRLRILAGAMEFVCAEMRNQGMDSIPVDGKSNMAKGLVWITAVARKAKGYLAGSDL
jgi:hypothetical protein